MRAYWRGDGGLIGEFARRLTGSSDLYGRSGRSPHASINFITAHDGFTLRDLVSYNNKHNEATLEDNRDGTDNNISWNCGVEGPTDDASILALRAQQSRNMLATLLLSEGVPMLTAGDERARTQQGNNNAYCQDNPLSWVDWTLDDARRRLLAFTQRIIQLRRQHPIFRRRRFFEGRALQGGDMKDIAWLTPEGTEMTEQEWTNGFARCLGVYLSGDLLGETDSRGVPVTDDDFIVLFNAHDGAIPFTLPKRDGWGWIVLVDTARNDGLVAEGTYQSASVYPLEARSLVLLQKVSPS
jgi:glycogen operon protein